jgi:hypothetical protein
MCDTLYAGAPMAADGRAWLAKNSDRDPREPQALCLVPQRPEAEAILVGKRVFPGPDRGYAFALSKPSWISGGEMGLNEKGVAIGNEAVFSRWKPDRGGALGMDILRAALSFASTAKEALDYIAAYVEHFSQGGNGAYKGHLYYDNSYIIADYEEAYILETAGKRWAWRKIEDFATISNAYGIETDYKRLDAQTRMEIAPVNPRAACSDEAEPGRVGERGSWKAWVEKRFYLRFTKGETRRACTAAALESARGRMDLGAVLAALRSHGECDPRRRGSMASPCMHSGGFPVSNASTASAAVEYDRAKGRAVLWFSASSYPCVSLYKPLLLVGGEFFPLWTGYDYAEGSTGAYGQWERQRKWIVKARAGALSLDSAFVARRDAAQGRLEKAVAALGPGIPGPESLEAARREVDAAVAEWLSGLEGY